MEIFPIILLMIAGLAVIIRPLTVLLHELGHAIPAILLTKEKVTIYIGSYQNPEKSLKLRFGRLLEILFRYNPFAWRLGLCIPSAKEISINKQIVYTLTGTITSFILGGITCCITFSYDLQGFLKFFLIIFLALAIIDLLGNLIPDQNPIELPDGSVIFNDGYALKYLFKLKKLDNLYLNAVDMYNNQQYADAATKFEQVLAHVETEEIFRLTIASLPD